MLSRLSRTASRLVDLWNDIEDENDDDSLTMSDLIVRGFMQHYCATSKTLIHCTVQLSDVHALSHSIRQDALETASNVCEGLINPLYRYVESSINADIDTVVRTLYESDPQFATLNDSQVCVNESISTRYRNLLTIRSCCHFRRNTMMKISTLSRLLPPKSLRATPTCPKWLQKGIHTPNLVALASTLLCQARIFPS